MEAIGAMIEEAGGSYLCLVCSLSLTETVITVTSGLSGWKNKRVARAIFLGTGNVRTPPPSVSRSRIRHALNRLSCNTAAPSSASSVTLSGSLDQPDPCSGSDVVVLRKIDCGRLHAWLALNLRTLRSVYYS